MKKLLLSCLALLPFLAVADPAPFSVTGAIKGIKDQTIYLRYGKSIDSLKSANGEFTFKGQVEDLTTAYLRVGKTQTSFFLEKNATLTLAGNLEELESASVSGNRINDDLSRYTASIAALTTIISMMASFIVSHTAIPVLCSMLLNPKHGHEHKDGFLTRGMKWLLENTLLRFGLSQPLVMLGMVLMIVITAFSLYPKMNKDFLPKFQEETALESQPRQPPAPRWRK